MTYVLHSPNVFLVLQRIISVVKVAKGEYRYVIFMFKTTGERVELAHTQMKGILMMQSLRLIIIDKECCVGRNSRSM